MWNRVRIRSPRVLRRSDRTPWRRLPDCQDAMGIRLSECNVQQQADGRPDDGLLGIVRRAARSLSEACPARRGNDPCLAVPAPARHVRVRTRTRMFTIAYTRMRTLCGLASERRIHSLAVSFAFEGLCVRKGTGARLEGERGCTGLEMLFLDCANM